MSSVQIFRAASREDELKFVFFPEWLYKQYQYWAPPLWWEERNAFNSEHNPILSDSDYILFLAVRDKLIIGRNLVYIDHSFNKYYASRIGFFGAFECIDDSEAAESIMWVAEDWLKKKGMEAVRGPINPTAECWGFLYEGFDLPQVFLSPYNPPYYNRFMEESSYQKVKDLLVYEADSKKGYKIPDRFESFTDILLKKKPELSVRRINKKELLKDAEAIWRITNKSLYNNWGYVPVNRQVMLDVVKKLKTILDEDAVWFVEDRGKPVAFALGYPDISGILKKMRGRLLPFGFLKLFLGLKKVTDYRLFSLAVLPEYHNLGLDVLLYMSLYKALQPKGVRLEANYILEDNHHIRNALEKLDMNQIKKYRVYEKAL